jgi:hypothetical protein
VGNPAHVAAEVGDVPPPGAHGDWIGTGGRTAASRFTMRDEYTGPLLPLIWRSMPDLGPSSSFRQFASGLKERAER